MEQLEAEVSLVPCMATVVGIQLGIPLPEGGVGDFWLVVAWCGLIDFGFRK